MTVSRRTSLRLSADGRAICYYSPQSPTPRTREAMRSRLKQFLILMVILPTACQPAAEPAPQPTSEAEWKASNPDALLVPEPTRVELGNIQLGNRQDFQVKVTNPHASPL